MKRAPPSRLVLLGVTVGSAMVFAGATLALRVASATLKVSATSAYTGPKQTRTFGLLVVDGHGRGIGGVPVSRLRLITPPSGGLGLAFGYFRDGMDRTSIAITDATGRATFAITEYETTGTVTLACGHDTVVLVQREYSYLVVGDGRECIALLDVAEVVRHAEEGASVPLTVNLTGCGPVEVR